ncbi:MAG: hypothetical protein ACEPOZ_01165 [Marinifilaceae bacterium]
MERKMQVRKLVNIEQLIVAITVMMLFISCQKDYVEMNEPDKSIAISANDPIADLIHKIVLKDGSFDNIIDRCSEISINYPYSVTIKEERIDITSVDDIKSITLEYFQFRNAIHINYPVTVSFSDYSESVLSNAGELHRIQNRYNGRSSDDDIECIDFQYPIEISMYNTRFQKSDEMLARNDRDMHRLFRDINDLIVQISFPVVVDTQNGKTISIRNNFELEDEIEKLIGTCDENDRVEFSDEDYPYDQLLIQKEWKVLAYLDNGNHTEQFQSYVLNFKEDHTIQINTNAGTFNGTWELSITGKLKKLKMEFDTDETPIAWLNQEWEIKNSSSINIEMETEKDPEGSKKKLILSSSE